MNKVLIELYVPSLLKSYDVYIPLRSTIQEVKYLLANAISDLSFHKYQPDSIITLCDYQTGKSLEEDKRVYECHIDNGKKLMLI